MGLKLVLYMLVAVSIDHPEKWHGMAWEESLRIKLKGLFIESNIYGGSTAGYRVVRLLVAYPVINALCHNKETPG